MGAGLYIHHEVIESALTNDLGFEDIREETDGIYAEAGGTR